MSDDKICFNAMVEMQSKAVGTNAGPTKYVPGAVL